MYTYFLKSLRNDMGNKGKSLITVMITIACVAALIAGILLFDALTGDKPVNAQEFRDGFSIVPEYADATGVREGSRFIFTSESAISVQDIKTSLTVNGGGVEVTKGEGGSGEFIVEPVTPLSPGNLVTFAMQRDDKKVEWTFQTSVPFSVLGSLPDNKTNGVPINTGIEIYFSHEDYEKLDNYFEISPKVNGKFEYHRSVAVFVPDKLEYGTLYTVTLKKGLQLKGTNHIIESDFTFQFETTVYDEKTGDSIIPKENIYFYKPSYEYSTSEEKFIPILVYYNYGRDGGDRNIVSADVKAKIYKYKTVDAYIEAAETKDEIPYWSRTALNNSALKADGLEKVAEFDQDIPLNSMNETFLNVPEKLEAGYYLIEVVWNKTLAQALIQVTDVAVSVVESCNGAIIWLNDLENTDVPGIEDAEIIPAGGTGSIAKTNADGIADLKEDVLSGAVSTNNKFGIFKAVLKDGRIAVFKIESASDNGINEIRSDYYYKYNYWSYLQLDRNLFKPDDTVYFQGMLRHRYSGAGAQDVIVEISKTNWFWGYYDDYVSYDSHPTAKDRIPGRIFIPWWIEQRPYAKAELKCENGFFSGSAELPQLKPGSYSVTLKYNGKIISSTMINVEDYVKPAFKLDITPSKKAVFADELFNINFKAGFFEGTPLSDTEFNYTIRDSYSSKYLQDNIVSGTNGEFNVNYTPDYLAGKQGRHTVFITARAQMPEMGEISASGRVMVFLNDVDLEYSAWRENGQGNVKVDLKNISLSKINEGLADSWASREDYTTDPVIGRNIHGTIYRCTWEKYFVKKEYDFISKQTIDRYEYRQNKQVYSQFDIVTDGDGTASYSLPLAEEENVWYDLELKTTDNKGREMVFGSWFSTYRYFGKSISETYIYPDIFWLDDGTGNMYESKNYSDGSDVGLTFKKGIDKLEGGRFLFIKAQNGIKEYKVSNKGEFGFKFGDADIPNVNIIGIWFNGSTHVSSQEYAAVYDYSKKALEVEAVADRDSYRPGDTVYVTVYVKDENGKPATGGRVSIAMVDEALFALQDYEFKVLETLYSSVTSGFLRNWASHYSRDNVYNTQKGSGGRYEVSQNAAAENLDGSADKAAGGDAIREDFRDTAVFKTAGIDSDGRAVFEFRIPDNITSWRLTAAAVSGDLKAGNGVANVKVTLPMFINYSMSTTFLEGDIPYVGVTAYGTELKSTDQIKFKITSAKHSDKVVIVNGKAFERIDLKLWKMEAGTDDLIISAEVISDKKKDDDDESEVLKDAVRQKIIVVKSYHSIRKAVFGTLEAGAKIPGGTVGETRIIFMDKGKAKFYPELYSMSWNFGNRIEQKFTSERARLLLAKVGEENPASSLAAKFEPANYQRTDGGLAILPYGPSDPYLSAILAEYLKDDIDKAALARYLYGIYYGNNPDMGVAALYGLASIGEPVLIDLERAYKDSSRSVVHSVYLALAYDSLKEKATAAKIYRESILPAVKELEPYMQVNVGSNQDDILKATALTAVLASKINAPEKDALYDYCVYNMSKDILLDVEKYLFISNEISKTTGTAADNEAEVKFSWMGDSEIIKPGAYGRSMSFPSAKLNELIIESVSGEIGYVSVFDVPWDNTTVGSGTGAGLSVSRKYSIVGREWDGVIRQGDIVKITLDFSIGDEALDGSYELCDYLPSGLKPIINRWRYGINDYGWGAWEISNSKVTFRVGKGWQNKGGEMPAYYARVISAGEYKAEGPSLQSEASRQSVAAGKAETITIE